MRLTLAIVVVLVACSPAETPALKQTVTYDRRQEIRIIAEPLESAVARGIIDLPKASSRETRDSGWSYAFIEQPPIAGRDTVRYPFQLRIDNRRNAVRFFDATIDYFDPGGATVRMRTLRRLMVPPFTRHTYEGEAVFPAGATITVQAAIRPIEPQ